MSDVKWIKITTDIFDDEKILLIESIPDAYAIIVVWFKLLCLAGKMNNSGVFVMGGTQMPYTDKMLATIFRMKESTVQLALNTFERFGMVEIIDGVITIPNWGKHQNFDQLENKKQYMRNYMSAYREKQKLIAGKSNEEPAKKPDDSKPGKEPSKETVGTGESAHIEIIDYLNLKAGTNYRTSTPKSKQLIYTRFREGFTIDDFKAVIDKKVSAWKGTDMEKYLRPETLFGTKFEGYLNERVYVKKNAAVPDGCEDPLDGLF